jgi:hypothetical protein
MARATIDWARYDQLKAQGHSEREIADALGIPRTTLRRELEKRAAEPTQAHPGTPATDHAQDTRAHPSTPARRPRHTQPHPGTPPSQPTPVHPGTPQPRGRQPTRVHPGTPTQQPTPAHPGVPMPNDLAGRLLALLPELEAMVTRERDRQRLLSTPIGTPRHTVKKTYVVDTLYVDLIERYARAEGLELKAVLNLALHEFFERRDYLPEEGS